MADADPGYALRTSHVTVSRWESGFTHPTVQRLEIFGKALNLSETEIDGLILMAGLDPGAQESRTLTCPQCGAETNGGSVTAVIRTRRCLGCGRSTQSCERWVGDPGEARNQRMDEILDRMDGANVQMRQALRDARTLHGFPNHGSVPEENESPGSQEESTVDHNHPRETATEIHDGGIGPSPE